MKSKSILFLLTSLFIVYHLVAVAIYPNPGSVLSRYLEPIFYHYGNQLNFNTTWQFFSPNPGVLRHIAYDVVKEIGDEIEVSSYQFPPKKALIYENQARLFYFAVRTVTLASYRKLVLIPYLCRLHPEATSIAIKTVEKFVPSMAKARITKTNDFESLYKEFNIPEEEFPCVNSRVSEEKS